MLKIKAPLKLKCDYSIEKFREDFSQRITGNYTLMNNYIRREELLYVTTQAPEVYFAEGDSFSIFNDIKNENQQEFRLDVINQLVNRILVSNTDNFTYQDSVYISNILRKIGITDVSKFMKQVHKLQEEKNENFQLVNLYEEQKDLLLNILKEEQNNLYESNEQNTDNEYINKSKYYIHEDIYKRLNTVDIYNDMKLFTQGVLALDKRIYTNEIAIAEQISMVQQFDLHNLKKEIFNNNQPINYYHANEYELMENDNQSKMDAQSRISAAILLNLVDNLYSLRLNQIEKNNHNWYILAGSLFQSSENTWKRYENYHNQGKKIYTNVVQTLSNIVDNKKTEKNIINSIINEIKVTKSELNNIEDNSFYENIYSENIERKDILNSFNKHYLDANFDSNIQNLSENIMDVKNNQDTFITYLEHLITQNDTKFQSVDYLNELIHLYQDFKQSIFNENGTINLSDEYKEKLYVDIDDSIETVNNVLNKIQNSEINIVHDEKKFEEIDYSHNIVQNKEENEYITEDSKNVNNNKEFNDISQKLIENNINNSIYQNNPQRIVNIDNMQELFIKYLEEMVTKESKEIHNTEVITELINLFSNYKHNIVNKYVVDNISDINVEQSYVDIKNKQESHINDLNEMQLNNVTDIHKDTFINEIENLHNYYQNNPVNNSVEDTLLNVNEYNSINNSLHTANNTNNELFNLIHLEEYISHAEDDERARQITEVTISKLDEINKQNLLNYQRIREIEQNRPKQKNVTVNKKKAREDILRALDNPQEVIMEYMQNNNVDNYNSINNSINNQIYNMFSDETKAIFNQVIQMQNKSGDNINLSTNVVQGNDKLQEVKEFFRENSNKEIFNEVIREKHFNNVDMIQKSVTEYDINEEINNSVKMFENQHINKLSDDKRNVDDISKKAYSKESIVEIINNNTDISLNMVQAPVVKYEISQMVRNEISELKNSFENNIYEEFFSEEVKPKKRRGRKSKATIELERRNEVKKVELQHFMEKSQQNDVVVLDKQTNVIFSNNVDFVHKKEEQVITEDLIETIKNQTVDLVKEETVTHNQVINYTKTKQQINDTVNEIKINNNTDIEEIVQQSMKKQLNHLTDQVYGKIEKKLQTERKRRGI